MNKTAITLSVVTLICAIIGGSIWWIIESENEFERECTHRGGRVMHRTKDVFQYCPELKAPCFKPMSVSYCSQPPP